MDKADHVRRIRISVQWIDVFLKSSVGARVELKLSFGFHPAHTIIHLKNDVAKPPHTQIRILKRTSMEGKPTPSDLAQFQDVIRMLQDKKNQLLSEIDELKGDISSLSADIKTEEAKTNRTEQQIADVEAQLRELPSKEERQQAARLQLHITDLESRITTVEEQIISKSEEKQHLLSLLHSPTDASSRRDSVTFIHKLLLNELSALVARRAGPDLLQRKERQIRLCEALMTM